MECNQIPLAIHFSIAIIPSLMVEPKPAGAGRAAADETAAKFFAHHSGE